MPRAIVLKINGVDIEVLPGSTVAAATALARQSSRISVTGEPRGPFCGMGICFECGVTINGTPHCRSCQILCQPGMEVRTDG